MKILNLYAGIGGNRTLWENVEVTAIEHDSRIAMVYQKRFPNDEVIIEDCIKFVENEDLTKFDFIWASPPCQTHTKWNVRNKEKIKVPNMTSLYSLYIFLNQTFHNLFVIENVKPYYIPLIKPSMELGRHYFWANFLIPKKTFDTTDLMYMNPQQLCEYHGIDFSLIDPLRGEWANHDMKGQILRNCVDREIGKYIMDCTLSTKKQSKLF